MNKTIVATIIVAVGLMIMAFLISTSGNGGVGNRGGNGINANAENVSIVDGKQIIEINVKGGYRPEKSIAKAGVSTIIRFKTNGTFDCSSFVRIPSLGVSQALSQTGTTDISVGTSSSGVLQGTCGMGMYRFEVEFR